MVNNQTPLHFLSMDPISNLLILVGEMRLTLKARFPPLNLSAVVNINIETITAVFSSYIRQTAKWFSDSSTFFTLCPLVLLSDLSLN